MCLTRQQWGLVASLLGSAMVAFSVRVKSTDTDVLKGVNLHDKIAPSQVTIIPFLFRGGLVLMMVGTLLQW